MTLEINTDYIKLNQALKLANLIGNGSDTKFLIEEERIKLNGNLVTEVRKKLYNDDFVQVEGIGEFKVKCI